MSRAFLYTYAVALAGCGWSAAKLAVERELCEIMGVTEAELQAVEADPAAMAEDMRVNWVV